MTDHDLQAALDWFSEDWRPYVAPEEALVAGIAWKRVMEAARQHLHCDNRYTGGFPITLEAMVAHAKATDSLDRLRELLEEADASR